MYFLVSELSEINLALGQYDSIVYLLQQGGSVWELHN